MKKRIETLLAQEKQIQPTQKSHVLPIYPTSAFSFSNIEEGIEVFTDPASAYIYSRFANPTVDSVAKKIADLESYMIEDECFALLCNTGMSAIHLAISSFVKQGDAILTQTNIYGGTTELLKKVLSDFGVETILTDFRNLSEVEQKINQHPNIKLVYFETPANPTLSCVDIASVCKLALSHKIISICDNTFASPYLQQPMSMGVDVVVHSTTKYMNGHGSGLGGAIVGRNLHYTRIWNRYKLMGSSPSPFESWLVHNGLKTLALRMERHSSNALSLANYLENHPKVARVNYPGLASHPDHALASQQMKAYGGMMSFELKGGLDAGKVLMNGVNICQLTPTLGNVDSLILHPASMSHLHVDKELREKSGITDGLIRLSVGIEHIEDLKADLGNALDLITN